MRTLIGMLTPSSNTVLEPMTYAMLAGRTGVSAHFSRIAVTRISLDAGALAQFDRQVLHDAAQLLADARVDAIAWNGTSGSWLGFDWDARLATEITAATSIPATTSVMALLAILRRQGISRIGLVTPYIPAVQARIVENFAQAGITCVSTAASGITDNFAFAEIAGSAIVEMIRRTAAARPEAIVILCTNLAGAPQVAGMESELDIPILDSVAVTMAHTLSMTGVAGGLVGWGRLLA
jgi:maleate isomerase